MLYGAKTTLRPAEAKDADLLNRWLHDPAVCGADVPLAQYHLPPPGSESARLFVIQAKGKAVGLLAARWPYGHRTPVELIGAVADARDRGQGIGTDALTTLLHYLFDSQPVTRLSIRCAVSNKPARRWLERLGFKLDGIERELFFFSGAFQDIALYGMTRADYDAKLHGAAPEASREAPRRPRAADDEAPPSRERPVRLSPERLADEGDLRPARRPLPREVIPEPRREPVREPRREPLREPLMNDEPPPRRRPSVADDDYPPRRPAPREPIREEEPPPRRSPPVIHDDEPPARPPRRRFRI